MINGIQSVCFIGCLANDKSLDKVIPTIGFGDWEAVTCVGIDAVVIVSDKDASDVKVGVIYHTMTRFNDGPDYFVLSVDNNKKSVYFDLNLTSNLEGSYAKNISELRRDIKN